MKGMTNQLARLHTRLAIANDEVCGAGNACPYPYTGVV
jgi:hypothetical protein